MDQVTLNILLAGLVSRAGGLLEELRGVTDMRGCEIHKATPNPECKWCGLDRNTLADLKPGDTFGYCAPGEFGDAVLTVTQNEGGRVYATDEDGGSYEFPSLTTIIQRNPDGTTTIHPAEPGEFTIPAGEPCPVCKGIGRGHTCCPVEEQPTPGALLHRIRDIWDLLDQDNPEIDKPLSAADFIEEIGPIMRVVRPE